MGRKKPIVERTKTTDETSGGPVTQLFDSVYTEDGFDEAELPPMEENAVPAPEPESKPKLPRRPRATADEKALSGQMHNAMESMVKQWSAARDISQAMATNLERISQMVQELPPKYTGALDQIFKQPPPKPTLVSKVALAASLIAIILSLVGLSMSQSTRQFVLTQEPPVAVPLESRHKPLTYLPPPTTPHKPAKRLK